MVPNENIFDRKRREIYHDLLKIGLDTSESWAEARLILEHVTGMKQAQQIVNDMTDFKTDWLHEITRIINQRQERRPLAYCLGEIEFAGLMFKIIPGVLIPRPDTETLVEAVIDRLRRGRCNRPTSSHSPVLLDSPASLNISTESQASIYIADIGVGSGAIAVSLLKRLPEAAVWGCDISEAAIATTLGNARRHNFHERLTLVHGDWKKILPHNFNVVVSNPPYLPRHLKRTREATELQPEIYFEPQSALFDGSEDGLSFYRQFAQLLPAHFESGDNPPDPFAAFEIGDKQEESILDIFEQSGWQNLGVMRDTNGLARVLTASPP